jgi:hypothetical protein
MLLCETRLELSERLRRGLPYSSIDRLLGGCNVTIGRAVGDEDQWRDKSMTFSTGNTAGADANGDGSGCGCSENRTIVSVCKPAGKGKQRTPSLLCLPIARRMRAAMADRFFRLVSTVDIRNFAHNVVSITSRSVRDRHPQIGKLEIGMCSGLHGGAEGEIKGYDARAMRTG